MQSMRETYLLSTDLPKRTKGTWYTHLLPLVLSQDFSNFTTLSAVVPFSIVLTKSSQLCYLSWKKNVFSIFPMDFYWRVLLQLQGYQWLCIIPFGREHLHEYTGVPFSFTVFFLIRHFLFFSYFLVRVMFYYFFETANLVNHGLFGFCSSSKKGVISSVHEFYCLFFSVSSSLVLQLLFMPYALEIFVSSFDGPNRLSTIFSELILLVDAFSTTSCSVLLGNLIHSGLTKPT